MKKISMLMMTVLAVIVCSFCALPTYGADQWEYKNVSGGKFSGGDGSYNRPYLICTAQDLADLAYLVRNDGKSFKGQCFRLIDNIALNDYMFDQSGYFKSGNYNVWQPIGSTGRIWDYDFEGTFDGNGHSISGLYINADCNEKDPGLFAHAYNAQITNLTIKDSYIERVANSYVGFIAGEAEGTTMLNCHVENSKINLNGNDKYNGIGSNRIFAGGLVGYYCGGTISSCSFSGSIKISNPRKDYVFLGGIAGLLSCNNENVKNCSSSGNIELKNINYSRTEASINGIGSSLRADHLNLEKCKVDMVMSYNDINKNKSNEVVINHFCDEILSYKECAFYGNISVNIENNPAKVLLYGPSGVVNDCAFYTKCSITNKTLNKANVEVHNMGESYYYKDEKDHIDLSGKNVLISDTYTDNDYVTYTDNINKTSFTSYAYYDNISDAKEHAQQDLANFKGISDVWGLRKDDGEYDGTLMPLAVGGVRQQPAPVVTISSLEQLKDFVESVNNGTTTTKGRVFNLDADINMTYSNEFIDGIGSEEHPFEGTFNGNGHAIIGLKTKLGSLFNHMNGTVKNLAIIGAELDDEQERETKIAPIARFVGEVNGTEKKEGIIQNCYVGGVIRVPEAVDYDKQTYELSGLCNSVLAGTIKDCYFDGVLSCEASNKNEHVLAGIVRSLNGTISNCYASFSVAGTMTDPKVFGLYDTDKSGSVARNNVWFVSTYADIVKDSYHKDQRLDSEEALQDKFGSVEGWQRGARRPLLKDVKTYKVTRTNDGNTETYYLDASPRPVDDNIIYNYVPEDGKGYQSDMLLWQLPNVAVLVGGSSNYELILNCNLNPSKDLVYTPDKTARYTNANMRYTLKREAGKSYYMLCLPGTVQRRDLPDGCKLMIGGQVESEDGVKSMNLVNCETVNGGVPFVLYVPEEVNGDINFIMRSRIAYEPVSTVKSGSVSQTTDLTGTFKAKTIDKGCATIDVVDGKPQFVYSDTEQQIAPFHAYISTDANVNIYDYILLNEAGNDISKVIDANSGHKTNVKLYRSMKKDAWNTLCVPFDMNKAEIEKAFGADTKVEALEDVAVDGDLCTLKFKAADEIEAGKSYLVKPTLDNIQVSTFDNRSISSQLNPTVKGYVDANLGSVDVNFAGSFERVMLSDDNTGSSYFIQDNKIYHVGSGAQVKMNGFRCYLTTSVKGALQKACLRHDDGTITSLRLVEVGSTADGNRVYDLQGIEQTANSQQRGVYIKGGRKYVK